MRGMLSYLVVVVATAAAAVFPVCVCVCPFADYIWSLTMSLGGGWVGGLYKGVRVRVCRSIASKKAILARATTHSHWVTHTDCQW